MREVNVVSDAKHAFFALTPERVFQAAEAYGWYVTGYCAALGSYENRVYEVEVEDPDTGRKSRQVMKFYRPNRWTENQIQVEHAWLKMLQDQEIPVVAPIQRPDGSTLFVEPETGIFYSAFPKTGGRHLDELDLAQLTQLGRLLGRVHGVGLALSKKFPLDVKPHLTSSVYATQALDSIRVRWDSDFRDFVNKDLKMRYESAVQRLSEVADESLIHWPVQWIHGDCHPGNLLWTDRGPTFLDFDDALPGPVIQDFWLLIGEKLTTQAGQSRMDALLRGYEDFHELEYHSARSLAQACEVLRALRWVHFSGWISKRFDDPSFKKSFHSIATTEYWRNELVQLESQLAEIG